MTRSRTGIYTDVLGRAWSSKELDRMLTDQDVCINASSILSIGLGPGGAFNGEAAYRISQTRYVRQEPAALLFTLALRLYHVGRAPRAAS